MAAKIFLTVFFFKLASKLVGELAIGKYKACVFKMKLDMT